MSGFRKGGLKRKKASLLIISIIVLAICAAVVIKRVSVQAEYDARQETLTQIQSKVEKANEDYSVLKKEQDYRTTDRYIEDVARDVLGLVYEDEYIFKPEEEDK